MARLALQHLQTVVEEGLQNLAQVHHARNAVGAQHVHIHRVTRFQIGGAIERFHQHGGVDIFTARFEHNANDIRRFVADIAQQRELFLAEQLGDFLNQFRFRHLIRHLGDDHLIQAVAQTFLLPPRANAEAGAPIGIGIDNRAARFGKHAAGWEIRALHVIHQRIDRGVRVLDEMAHRVAQLKDIMRRHGTRHAHGDAFGAIGQQVRVARRHHHRLGFRAVVRGAEIDRVGIHVLHQQHRRIGQLRFGITHGRRVIAIDGTEVPLPIDERIAHREGLR